MENLIFSDFGNLASIISLITGLLFGSSICLIKKITRKTAKEVYTTGNNNTVNTDIKSKDFVGRDKK